MNSKTTNIIAAVVLVTLAFYGGTFFSRKDSGPVRQGNLVQFGDGAGRRFVGMNGAQANFAAGEILAKDDNSMTVKTQDGSSKLVFFSTSTQIMKTSSGSFDDLKSGETVTVTGVQNADGSITAQSVQLRPAGALIRRIGQ